MQHSDYTITNEAALRQHIPAYNRLLDKRIQPQLDVLALEFIEHAHFALLYCLPDDGSGQGQLPGFYCINKADWRVDHKQQITLTQAREQRLPKRKRYTHGSACLLMLIPGVDHLLRINGRFSAPSEGELVVTITQVYLHCGRAAQRARLWPTKATAKQPLQRHDLRPFIAASQYLLLSSRNPDGTTLMSPRGENPGQFRLLSLPETSQSERLQPDIPQPDTPQPDTPQPDTTQPAALRQPSDIQLLGAQLLIPDRPGNKIAASLRNLLANPTLDVVLMIPGCPHVLQLHGQAQISCDPEILAHTKTEGKTAKLAIVMTIQRYQLQYWAPLAEPHNGKRHPSADSLTPFAKALATHMNGDRLLGKVTHLLVDRVVKHGEKHLY